VKRAVALLILMGLALESHEAAAQVRWDVGGGVGVAGRFLSSSPAGQGGPSAGPAFEAEGHIVVFPLVRVGAYLHFDESPVAGNDANVTRDVFAGGLDVRLVSPWPEGDTRLYLRAGIGEAGIVAPSHLPLTADSGSSTSGRFTEVPLAIGVAYRPYPPFWLTAEAGARLGFAFGGTTYAADASLGEDKVAVYGTVGVMWGR
jgi:hypothetical protein